MRQKFFKRLRARGYPADFIAKAMEKAQYADRQRYLFPAKPLQADADGTVQLRLKVPHDSFFNSMKLETILNLHWKLVQGDPDLKRIFPRKPMIVRKRTDTVRDMINKAYAKTRTKTKCG